MKKKKEEEKKQEYTLKEEIKEGEPFSFDLKLSLEEEQKIIRRIKNKVEKIRQEKNSHKDYESESPNERFKNADKYYNLKVDYTNWPFSNAANIPGTIVPVHTDSAVSGVTRALGINPPYWIEGSVDDQGSGKKQNLLQALKRNKVRDYGEAEGSCLNSTYLKGTGILKNTWLFEKKFCMERNIYNGREGLKILLSKYSDAKQRYPEYIQRLEKGEKVVLYEKVEKVTYNAPQVEWVPVEKFLIEEKCSNTSEADFVGEEMTYTYSELLDLEKRKEFKNVASLLELEISKDEKDEKDQSAVAEETDYSDHEFNDIISCIFETEINGEKKKCIFVISEQKEIMLQSKMYVYLHNDNYYIDFHINPFTGSFWRRGFYDMLKAKHDEKKRTHDLILNSAYITFIPSFKKRRGSSYDPHTQKWYPGSVTVLDDLDDVVQWDIRPSQLPFTQQDQQATMESYEISGESPYSQGVPMSGQESGKKVSILLSAGSVRTMRYLKFLSYGFNRLAFQWIEMYKQNIEEEKVILSDKELTITANDLAGTSLSYIANLTTENINPDVILERNTFMLEILSKMPMIAGNMFAIRDMLEKFIISARYGWENLVDKLLPSKGTLMKINQGRNPMVEEGTEPKEVPPQPPPPVVAKEERI